MPTTLAAPGAAPLDHRVVGAKWEQKTRKG
jgi:hypothetical protein